MAAHSSASLPSASAGWTSAGCICLGTLACPAVALPRRTLPSGRAGLADVSKVGRGRSRSGSKKLHASSKKFDMLITPSSYFVHISSIFRSTSRALTGLLLPKVNACFTACKSNSVSAFDLTRASEH